MKKTEKGLVGRIRHGFNFIFDPKTMTKKAEGKSETIPDEAMSIKELLKRHTRGENLGGGQEKTPLFYGDNGQELDFHKLDKMEQAEKIKEVTQELKGIRDKIVKQNVPVPIEFKEKLEELERLKKENKDLMEQAKKGGGDEQGTEE